MRERKLITRRDALSLAALFLLCVLVFFAFSRLPKGAVAVVERNGEEVLRRELSSLSGPVEEAVQGENSITVLVEISPDGAAVRSSQCPDKLCVHMGKLTRAGEAAVCLPARVTLRLEGAGAVDGVTY